MKFKAGIVVCFFFLGCSFAQESVSSASVEIQKDEVVDSIYGLEGVFVENQYQYLPVSPPSESVFFQSLENVVPVDWKRFPSEFTKQMYAEMDENGFPLYRVSVYEDASTRQTVFLNMYGKEVFRLDPAKDYDPYAWQKVAFGEESYLMLDELNRWIFDPAHIAVDLVLIPTVFHSDYLALEEESASAESVAAASSPAVSETVSVSMALVPAEETETLAVESEPVAMTLDSSPPPVPDDGSNTNNISGGGGSSNLVVELAINLPEGFGQLGHIEIFTKDDLIYSTSWSGGDNWVPTLGRQTVYWVDPTSSNKSERFYYIGDGTDSDGDGYSDLWEAWVAGTASNSFDTADVNGNGINDWWDEKIFGQVSTNQMLADDTDEDGLANYMEITVDSVGRVVAMVSDPNMKDSDADNLEDWPERMVWHTGSMNPDTDGDGLGDGEEINASPRTDPHNPDTGAPIVVFAGN